MGTVCGYIQCPQCSFPQAVLEHWTPAREDDVFCPACGYYYRSRVLIDRHKSSPGEIYWLRDEEGQPIRHICIQPGYGMVAVKKTGSDWLEYHPFRFEPGEEAIASRIKLLLSDPEIDASASYVSRWDEAAGLVVLEFGQYPESGILDEGVREEAESQYEPGEIPF